MTINNAYGELFLSDAILELLKEQNTSLTVGIDTRVAGNDYYTYFSQTGLHPHVQLFSANIEPTDTATVIQIAKLKMPADKLLELFKAFDEKYPGLTIEFL